MTKKKKKRDNRGMFKCRNKEREKKKKNQTKLQSDKYPRPMTVSKSNREILKYSLELEE